MRPSAWTVTSYQAPLTFGMTRPLWPKRRSDRPRVTRDRVISTVDPKARLARKAHAFLRDGVRSALVTRFRYNPAALRPTPTPNKIGRSSPFVQEGTA